MTPRRLSLLGPLVLLGFFGASSAHAAEVTLADCFVDGGTTADQLDRAFYMRDFPASNLGKVTLDLQQGTDGASYIVTVTAHDQTFDGPVIGAVTVEVHHVPARAVFDFHGAPTVPHHTIAFAVGLPITDGGTVYMAANNGPCAAIRETEDDSPPLSTDRSPMSASVTTYGPEISAVSPNMGSPAGGSTVNITSSFVGPDAILTFGGSQATSISLPDGGVGDGGVFTAVTPPHAEGEVDVDIAVTYVNDGGVDASAIASLHNGYFYGSDVVDSGGGGGTSDSGATTSRADGGDNGATAGSDDSGCGCDLPGAESAPGSFAVALVAVGSLLGARRRRKR